MKLFRSKEEILQDDKIKQQKEKVKQQFEIEFTNFFKVLTNNSEEDINVLENILLHSKKEYDSFFESKAVNVGLYEYFAINNSILVNFNILKQVHNNNKSIDTLIEQNKELENKFDFLIKLSENLESKFDILIKQNEELNNKFDQLIEILKSK